MQLNVTSKYLSGPAHQNAKTIITIASALSDVRFGLTTKPLRGVADWLGQHRVSAVESDRHGVEGGCVGRARGAAGPEA